MTAVELPDHHRRAISHLIRYAVVFMFLGMILGIVSTDYQRELRYTSGHADAPRAAAPGPDGKPPRHEVELPPGMMWEVGFDLRILHGHFILIGGVIPLCVAACLFFLPHMGAKPVSSALLTTGMVLYLVGAVAALALIFYKGIYSLNQVIDKKQFDLAEIQASMFLGSRGLRAAAHAISHTVLAAGLGVLGFALWRSAGQITRPAPANSSAPPF